MVQATANNDVRGDAPIKLQAAWLIWISIFAMLLVLSGTVSYGKFTLIPESILIAWWLGTVVAQKGKWRRTPLDGAVLFWMLCELIGVAWTFHTRYGLRSSYPALGHAGPDVPFRLLLDQMAGFAAYYLVVWHSHNSADRFASLPPHVSGFVIGAMAGLMCGFLDMVQNLRAPTPDWRMAGALQNPNLFASFLIPAILVPVGVALQKEQPKLTRASLAVLAAVGMYAFWLTQSRGTFLGMMLAAAYIGLALWLRHRPGVRVRTAALAFALACTLVLFLGALEGTRMAGKMHREDSSVQRQVIYQASFILIREHPLMGIGVGGFMPAMADLGLAEPGATINGKRVMIHSIHLHAHNIILECWLERGLLGVFALGWFAILAIRRSVTLLRPTSNQSMIALAGMAAVIALAVQMVADYTLWDAPVMITTWLVVGLAFTHSAGSVKA